MANALSISRIYEFDKAIKTVNKTPVIIDRSWSIHILSSELSIYKSIMNSVCAMTECSYSYCIFDQNIFVGFLNATSVLEKANISNLVQFYDNRNIRFIWINSSKLNGGDKNSETQKIKNTEMTTTTLNLNYENHFTDDERIEVNDEYWNLWNSNNMSMLNISSENFGHDGSRIELGNLQFDFFNNYLIKIFSLTYINDQVLFIFILYKIQA